MVMAIRTHGTVDGSGVGDRLEGPTLDIGGVVNRFTFGVRIKPRTISSTQEILISCRSKTNLNKFPMQLGLIQATDGLGNTVMIPRFTLQNDASGNGTLTAHYQQRLDYVNLEQEEFPQAGPNGGITVDTVWLLGCIVDYSGGSTAPDTVIIVVNGTQYVMDRSEAVGTEVPQANAPVCLGFMAGTGVDAANDPKCLDCEFQDLFYYPGLITASAFWSTIAAGGSPFNQIDTYPGLLHWTCGSTEAIAKESSGGTGLTRVGTTSNTSTFAGTTIMPVTLTCKHDAYIQSTAASTDFSTAPTIRIGYNTGTTATLESLLQFLENMISEGIAAGSTIDSALLNFECTTGAVAAVDTWEVRRVLPQWDDGPEGVSWNSRLFTTGTAWETPGALGALDSTTIGRTTGLARPTTTGPKQFDIKDTIQKCLDSDGGNVNIMCLMSAFTTTGIAQFSSREGATPPTIDIEFTPPAGFPAAYKHFLLAA